MKQRKSLFFRLKEPTEEELLAEIDEFFSALSQTLINPTVEDFAAAAKIFFAPAVRTALQRRTLENKNLRASNLERRHTAAVDYKQYRNLIKDLYSQDPKRKRYSRNRLARLIQERLAAQGKTVSARTILRALPPKK